MPSPSRRISSPGFTLIELMVVVAIIAVLAAFAFPMLGKMRSSADRSTSASNLKQIGAAVLTYMAENNGRYPQSIAKKPGGGTGDTWHQAIAPILDFNPPNGQWNLLHDEPNERAVGIWNNPANDDVPGDIVRAGNYADYGWNHRLGGWATSDGGDHLKTVQRPVKIPMPSKVFMVTEVKECRRDFRDSGWDSATAYHGDKTPTDDTDNADNRLNMLYADGHIEVLTGQEMDDFQQNGNQNDYPWGWPGYSY